MDGAEAAKTEKAKATTFEPAADAKATADQFTTAANAAFKDGVEKTLSALSEANTHSKKNLEAAIASVTAAAKGAEALGSQAAAFSKSAFDTQVNAAKALASAKTPQEFFELQAGFARGAFETYVSEFTRMSDTLAASVRESVKPLNERVTDVVGRLQAVR